MSVVPLLAGCSSDNGADSDAGSIGIRPDAGDEAAFTGILPYIPEAGADAPSIGIGIDAGYFPADSGDDAPSMGIGTDAGFQSNTPDAEADADSDSATDASGD